MAIWESSPRLADEVLLLGYPILLGAGKRFFSDGAPRRELALAGTKAASSGVGNDFKGEILSAKKRPAKSFTSFTLCAATPSTRV